MYFYSTFQYKLMKFAFFSNDSISEQKYLRLTPKETTGS